MDERNTALRKYNFCNNNTIIDLGYLRKTIPKNLQITVVNTSESNRLDLYFY